MPQDGKQVLQTQRLVLREMGSEDFTALKIMLADAEVMAAWEKTFTDEEVQEWIARQQERYQRDGVGYWLAERKDTGEAVGQIGLLYSDILGERRYEVGYILNREYWHKGYAREGAQACAQYVFGKLGEREVYATIRPQNAASLAVAQAIGMHPAGEIIKHYEGKEMAHLLYKRVFAHDPPAAVCPRF